ncbi:hypothetical protein BDW02DRAFT_200429 [Decorospora gaudefroyi]|uniref:Uncharacterized protein n=1 Tax=Decorospora gaudefroyi TaxID=184978 RepID=A0A6A5JXC9_9PLEO|nr:hypothetical protein BDW02DRAFT_200429 [Decorospora gaudefroyi]
MSQIVSRSSTNYLATADYTSRSWNTSFSFPLPAELLHGLHTRFLGNVPRSLDTHFSFKASSFPAPKSRVISNRPVTGPVLPTSGHEAPLIRMPTNGTSPPLGLPTNTIQLPLEPGDRLPNLEEFEIRAKNYHLDAQHSNQLLDCVDFTKLKRMVLASSELKAFFDVFAAKLPQLNDLDFAYPRLQYGSVTADYDLVDHDSKVVTCAAFLRSLPKLKALVIRCRSIDPRERFW